LETAFPIRRFVLIQIEGVKSERFAFGQEDASKGLAGVTVRVSTVNIDDVQLAGRHQRRDISARRCKPPFHIESGARDPQLI
jgi:hypothetical protein